LHEIGQVLTLRADPSSENRVPFSVHFGVSLDDIPDDTRQEIQRTMDEIALVVASIPPTSPFWSSMDDSFLKIDVRHFRLVYRVDPVHSEIVVVEVSRL
jgi:mRNA-degrading endonuclease RelE of RelBE toxin-antitoxin system